MPDRPRTQRTSESSYDPLNASLQPPANETEEEKALRLEAAREAVRVSRTIDAGLAESKRAMDRKKRAVKILLLGQSESGKSSVLRNFRLAFTPKFFETERLVWKPVIHLNLISSIKKILTVLQEEWSALENDAPDTESDTPLSSEHRRLALSLSPLLAFETSISQLIASDSSSGGYTVTVRPGGGWKDKIASFGRSAPASPIDETADPSQVMQVLAACKDEIIALWEDTAVRRLLDARGVYLQEDAGFFLDDTARITAIDYVPLDRDIMRARIRTLGVEEHRFVTESGFRAGGSVMVFVGA